MVANLSRFNLFGVGKPKEATKNLPGKSDWKSNSSTTDQGNRSSDRHQDSWVHISNNTNRPNRSSLSQSTASSTSSSSSSSIKIPSNNEFYQVHKQRYRQENKENKRLFPNTCGDPITPFGRTRGISESESRGRSKTTSGNYASSSSSYQTYQPRNRSPGERLRETHGDVLMDWVSKMDL